MPLRLIEITLPRDHHEKLLNAIEEWKRAPDLRVWTSPAQEGYVDVHIMIEVGDSESIMDAVESKLPLGEDYRVAVLPVEATLPRLRQADEEESEGSPQEKKRSDGERISREELYNDAMDMTSLTKNYLVLVGLSAVVASIGLLRNNVAVLIGSMVIAPLLGPNIALALSTALGDGRLFRAGAKVLGAGILVSFIVAVLTGLVFHPSLESDQVASRTVLQVSDVILALASGSAGVLSLTMGISMTMVGVMVALSLLPPLAASGLLLGSGDFGASAFAGLLCLTNIICLNLAGVVTLIVQGVRPLRWTEKENARKTVIKALVSWAILLLALLAVIGVHKYLGK